MKMLQQFIACILMAAGLCGCATANRSGPTPAIPEIDGILTDAVWEQVPSRPLLPPQDRADAGRILVENGNIRFSHAEGTLYVSAEFDDSYLITAGETDGDDLYHGDCCEIFIKPAGELFYWEVWISPDALRSVAKWWKKGDLEAKGRLLDGQEIQVVTRSIEGSGWTLEAALPLPELPGQVPPIWEILIARQNYDGSLSKDTRELSSFPLLLKSDFHRHEEYYKLRTVELR